MTNNDTPPVAAKSAAPLALWLVLLAAAGAVPEGKITREGLDWLYDQLITARSADRVRMNGLKREILDWMGH